MPANLNQPSLLSPHDHPSGSRAPTRTARRLPAWLRSDKLKIGGSLLALLIAGIVLFFSLSGEDAASTTKSRQAIDSVTGAIFEVRIVDGDRFPWKNPDTGDLTLYPVEKCYWTRDGKAKLHPTLVFVKLYAGVKEKTLCPDCGREVRQHNPLPPDELLAEAAEQKRTD